MEAEKIKTRNDKTSKDKQREKGGVMWKIHLSNRLLWSINIPSDIDKQHQSRRTSLQWRGTSSNEIQETARRTDPGMKQDYSARVR